MNYTTHSWPKGKNRNISPVFPWYSYGQRIFPELQFHFLKQDHVQDIFDLPSTWWVFGGTTYNRTGLQTPESNLEFMKFQGFDDLIKEIISVLDCLLIVDRLYYSKGHEFWIPLPSTEIIRNPNTNEEKRETPNIDVFNNSIPKSLFHSQILVPISPTPFS